MKPRHTKKGSRSNIAERFANALHEDLQYVEKLTLAKLQSPEKTFDPNRTAPVDLARRLSNGSEVFTPNGSMILRKERSTQGKRSNQMSPNLSVKFNESPGKSSQLGSNRSRTMDIFTRSYGDLKDLNRTGEYHYAAPSQAEKNRSIKQRLIKDSQHRNSNPNIYGKVDMVAQTANINLETRTDTIMSEIATRSVISPPNGALIEFTKSTDESFMNKLHGTSPQRSRSSPNRLSPVRRSPSRMVTDPNGDLMAEFKLFRADSQKNLTGHSIPLRELFGDTGSSFEPLRDHKGSPYRDSVTSQLLRSPERVSIKTNVSMTESEKQARIENMPRRVDSQYFNKTLPNERDYASRYSSEEKAKMNSSHKVVHYPIKEEAIEHSTYRGRKSDIKEKKPIDNTVRVQGNLRATSSSAILVKNHQLNERVKIAKKSASNKNLGMPLANFVVVPFESLSDSLQKYSSQNSKKKSRQGTPVSKGLDQILGIRYRSKSIEKEFARKLGTPVHRNRSLLEPSGPKLDDPENARVRVRKPIQKARQPTESEKKRILTSIEMYKKEIIEQFQSPSNQVRSPNPISDVNSQNDRAETDQEETTFRANAEKMKEITKRELLERIDVISKKVHIKTFLNLRSILKPHIVVSLCCQALVKLFAGIDDGIHEAFVDDRPIAWSDVKALFNSPIRFINMISFFKDLTVKGMVPARNIIAAQKCLDQIPAQNNVPHQDAYYQIFEFVSTAIEFHKNWGSENMVRYPSLSKKKSLSPSPGPQRYQRSVSAQRIEKVSSQSKGISIKTVTEAIKNSNKNSANNSTTNIQQSHTHGHERSQSPAIINFYEENLHKGNESLRIIGEKRKGLQEKVNSLHKPDVTQEKKLEPKKPETKTPTRNLARTFEKATLSSQKTNTESSKKLDTGLAKRERLNTSVNESVEKPKKKRDASLEQAFINPKDAEEYKSQLSKMMAEHDREVKRAILERELKKLEMESAAEVEKERKLETGTNAKRRNPKVEKENNNRVKDDLLGSLKKKTEQPEQSRKKREPHDSHKGEVEKLVQKKRELRDEERRIEGFSQFKKQQADLRKPKVIDPKNCKVQNKSVSITKPSDTELK